MKKLLCASLIALTASTSAFAAEKGSNLTGFYAGVGAGLSATSKMKTKTSDASLKRSTEPVYGLFVGYKVNDMFRFDINGQFRDSDTKLSSTGDKFSNHTMKSNTKTVFLNGYVDYTNESMFTPYLTAGFGYQNQRIKDSGTFKNTDGNDISVSGKGAKGLAFNTGLGVRAALSKNVDLDLGYRIIAAKGAKYTITNPTAKLITTLKAKGNIMHELTLGVAYNF